MKVDFDGAPHLKKWIRLAIKRELVPNLTQKRKKIDFKFIDKQKKKINK